VASPNAGLCESVSRWTSLITEHKLRRGFLLPLVVVDSATDSF
jgi:hypothetical protein